MNSTERLTRGSITLGFPPLRQPKPETVDRGTTQELRRVVLMQKHRSVSNQQT
jgi:hypothetical protein